MMNRLEMPLLAIRSQIASAIQIIMQASRLRDGSRRITHISELTGLDEQGNYLIQDLFLLEIIGVEADGKLKTEFKPTGVIPTFMDEANRSGIKMPATLFERS